MGKRLSPKETVRNAKRSIGKKGYDALDNNCEHFATECKTGKARSKQSSNFTDKAADAIIVGGATALGGPAGGMIVGGLLALAENEEKSKSKSKPKPKSKPKSKPIT